MSGSLLDMAIQRKLSDYVQSDSFRDMLRLRVKWLVQGFAEGFDLKDRERFTETVAARIRSKSKRPTHVLWWTVYWLPTRWTDCRRHAEQIVTDFLRDNGIQFGDPDFYWGDGNDIADEEMSYWDA